MLSITVIVPVFNAETTLDRCVTSILNQTFIDFGLLLIDDGSPDNSGEICDLYAAKDSRIHVIHKKNGGVGSARNAGLKNATGNWICFVDADDWVEENYLNDLITTVHQGTDFVLTGIEFNSEKGEILKVSNFPETISSTAVLSFVPLIFKHNVGPSCKLFKTSIIKEFGLKFNESISTGEDCLFLIGYLDRISSISFVDRHAYHYIRYSGVNTLSTRHIPADELLTFHTVRYRWVLDKQSEWQEKNPDFIYLEDKKYLLGVLSAVVSVKREKTGYKSLAQKVRTIKSSQKPLLKSAMSNSWETRLLRRFLLISHPFIWNLLVSVLMLKYFKSKTLNV